jgi:hypothetical protein
VQETIKLVKEQKSILLAGTELLDDIEKNLENAQHKELVELYSDYKKLCAKMTYKNFLIQIRLRKEMFSENKALIKDTTQRRLFWSARMGRDLDPETGIPLSEKYGVISAGSFTGTISEWNHSLINVAKNLVQRITKGVSEEGIVHVPPSIYAILRTSPLFMPIREGDLLGRIEVFDIYEDKELEEDTMFVLSPEGTAGFIIVKDL